MLVSLFLLKKQLGVPVNKHSFIFGTSKRYTKYIYGYNELLITYPLYFEKPLSYRLFIIFIKCQQTEVYLKAQKILSDAIICAYIRK